MTSERKCPAILEKLYKEAGRSLTSRSVSDSVLLQKTDYAARCSTNRAAVRLLMSCLLAKIHKPEIDIRKPYTEIGGKGVFSGRAYDEKYLSDFINKYELPCNATTAFLTPALRNINKALTLDAQLIGRPRDVYRDILFLLDAVNKNKIKAEALLLDCIRILITVKNENAERLRTLMSGLKASGDKSHLSVEEIINLLVQHLACKNSSRLSVLIVAAAYKSAEKRLKQKILPLKPHTAADRQTKAFGDVEITLADDDNVVTCYEMKTKEIIENDIHAALEKIKRSSHLDSYIFITTEPVKEAVQEIAKKSCSLTGVETAVLDCIGFIKHFLYLFYRIRMSFLDEYQKLVLNEPAAAVSQELKEAFIVLRKACEQE